MDYIKFIGAVRELQNESDQLSKADTMDQIVDILEEIDQTMKSMWNMVESDKED